jgi:hypothetical protein
MRSAEHPFFNASKMCAVSCFFLAAAVGVFGARVPAESVFLAFGAVLILSFFLFVEHDSLFISVVILSTSVNMQFWFDHRFVIGSFPIAVPDLIAILYGFYGLIRWVRRPRLVAGPLGFLVFIWSFYFGLFGIRFGLENGSSIYAIFQEYRLVAYATVAFFATTVIFRPDRHMRLIIWSIVTAGVVASVWSLIGAISTGFQVENIVYMTRYGVERVGRDIEIPLRFAGDSLVMLIVAQLECPDIFGRCRRVIWGLVPVLIGAMIVAMTRTYWLELAACLCLLAVYLTIQSFRRGLLFRVVTVVVVAITSSILGKYLLQFKFPNVYEAVIRTWGYTLSSNDKTFYGRFEAIPEIVSYLDRYSSLWQGIGFGNISDGSSGVGPYYNVHNTYVAYMVIGGLAGLVLFLMVWWAPIVGYVRLLPTLRNPVIRAFVVASVINWIAMSIIMMAYPAAWMESALFGLTLGIACRLFRYSRLTDQNLVLSS